MARAKNYVAFWHGVRVEAGPAAQPRAGRGAWSAPAPKAGSGPEG